MKLFSCYISARLKHQRIILVRLLFASFIAAPIAAPSLAEVSNYSVTWQSTFNLPNQDSNGWSVLTPSSDSRIIYVASSGNDNTAQYYSRASTEVGSNVFNPSGAIKPYATISAAMSQARAGYPDYVLLKRGDTWTTSTIQSKGGRSVSERSVISYYGTAAARPVLKTGTDGGVSFKRDSNFSAVIGIEFIANLRNPSASDFVGFSNVGGGMGFYAYVGGSEKLSGVLIEDCKFNWYAQNAIQSVPGDEVTSPYITDFVVRRSILSNNYAVDSHSQGLYSKNSSVLLEENIFDHNGWYKTGAKEEGGATIFNHNTYFAVSENIIFRKNMFLRASSIGNKFTANPVPTGADRVMARNILLDNNLYVEGEIGVSLGGNNDYNTGSRFENVHVINNVMMHIGRTEPTQRNLGWGLDVSDWKGGMVKGNTFTSWGDSSNIVNTYALNAVGHTTNVSYTDNIIYNISGGSSRKLVLMLDGQTHKYSTFSRNQIQATSSIYLIEYALDSTSKSEGNLFYSPTSNSSIYMVGESLMNLSGYLSAAKDTTSTFTQIKYIEPSRTVETYMTALGQPGTLNSLVTQVNQQSKFNWRNEYTTASINEYIRNGFCVSGQDCSSDPIISLPRPPTLIEVKVN